jgi:hypothetical protein
MASSTGAQGADEAGAATGASSGPEADKDAGESPARSTGADQRGEGPPDPAHGSLASETLDSAERVSCIMNAHYHGAREGFLDTTHRWFMFAVIVFGAAAFADLIPKSENDHKENVLKGFLGAGAALFGALDLTFDLSNRARAHSLMKRRYYELLAELREGKKSSAETRVCLDRFSADEEPPYRALLLSCWNRTQREVHGTDAYHFHIPWLHRLFKNWFRWTSTDFGSPFGLGESQPYWLLWRTRLRE